MGDGYVSSVALARRMTAEIEQLSKALNADPRAVSMESGRIGAIAAVALQQAEQA